MCCDWNCHVPRPSGPEISKTSQKRLSGPPGPECQKVSRKSKGPKKESKGVKISVRRLFLQTSHSKNRERAEFILGSSTYTLAPSTPQGSFCGSRCFQARRIRKPPMSSQHVKLCSCVWEVARKSRQVSFMASSG